MKKLVQFVLYRVLGKKLYTLIKPFYTPSEITATKLRFYGPFEVKMNDGTRFKLYNSSFYLESIIYWLGFEKYDWEKNTRKVWIELCKKSDVIFDIGANTGIFSVLAKAYNPQSTVYAFEPQPNIFDVLSKNNQINEFDINCNKLALSDVDGELPFYNYGDDAFTSGNTTAGSLNSTWRQDNQVSISVPVKLLDDFIKEKVVPKIDLIKIDVETLEFEVLNGYEKYLKIHQPIIVLEIQSVEIGEKVGSLLDEYSFYLIDETKGIVKVDRLGGAHERDNNYVACPIDKLAIMEKM
jgi:FkbM family methyltransferase